MKAIEWQSPAIEECGKIKFYPQSKLLPTNDKEYKLLFNISSNKKKEGLNAVLVRMAKALNMFKAAGIDADRIQLSAIIYSKAYPVVLNDDKHREAYGKPNPNTNLLEELHSQNVKFYVCGQTLAQHNTEISRELNQYIEVTLSALVAFPEFDARGYTLIP